MIGVKLGSNPGEWRKNSSKRWTRRLTGSSYGMPRIAILDANENGIRHLGYSLGELRQMTTAEVHDQGFEEGREERRRARETTDHLLFESVHIRKDCSRVPVELNTRLVEYGGRKVMQSFVRDLSGRKQTEEKLKTAQARAEKDDHARNALMIGNNRIMAMARVHEKLYGSTDLANIGAAEYLEGIVGSVMAGRSENHREVFCSFDIEDIILTGDQAIPCGLMVNELISNALKHGFSNRQSGEIEVSLHRLEDEAGTCRRQ